LYFPGVLDTYIMGLADQRSGRMDAALTTEVANHLFEKPGNFFGFDLAAINIQRAREMGVRGYNSYREFCGLPRAKSFADLTGAFSNKTLLRMAQVYKHVDDIDLFTGGISEYPVAGGLIGPTFSCLVAKQLALLRVGDRFWYENPGQFSLDQLDQIRRQTSARLICDNSDDLEDVQKSAMLMPDQYANPRVPCSSLPSIDLTKWKELPPPASGGQQQPRIVYATPDTPSISAMTNAEAQPTHRAPPTTTISVYPDSKLAPLGATTATNRAPVFQGPLSFPHQGHLMLLIHALQQYQRQGHGNSNLDSAIKTFSHYIDHLVDATKYRVQEAH
jgi:hypothetical protein